TVDGTDVPACHEVCRDAVSRARRGEGPTLIDAKIWRINSHTSEDNQAKYRTKEEMVEATRHDPLVRFTSWLIDRRWITSGVATARRQRRRTGRSSSRIRSPKTP